MDAHDTVATGTIPPGPEHAAQMLQMITGYRVTQMVGAVAELRIADYLSDDAVPAEAAGLKPTRVVETDSPYAFLEAVI